MNQIPVKLGPLALLLTVISICLTALAILVFTTARADMRLAEKYSETVSSRYELEKEGQELLADIRINGPGEEAETAQDGSIQIKLRKNEAVLTIGLAEDDGRYRITKWIHEREWTPDTSIGNLWTGN